MTIGLCSIGRFVLNYQLLLFFYC